MKCVFSYRFRPSTLFENEKDVQKIFLSKQLYINDMLFDEYKINVLNYSKPYIHVVVLLIIFVLLKIFEW